MSSRREGSESAAGRSGEAHRIPPEVANSGVESRARARVEKAAPTQTESRIRAAVMTALVELWHMFEPCGHRLTAVLREQVERLRELEELGCTDAGAEQLDTISASTIDRLLRREKRVRM